MLRSAIALPHFAFAVLIFAVAKQIEALPLPRVSEQIIATADYAKLSPCFSLRCFAVAMRCIAVAVLCVAALLFAVAYRSSASLCRCRAVCTLPSLNDASPSHAVATHIEAMPSRCNAGLC